MNTTTSELAESVRSALRAQAESVELDDEPFDPAKPGLTSGSDPSGLRPAHRPRPRRALAAALACCVIAAGVTVAVANRHRSGGQVETPTEQAPFGLTWLPDRGPESPAPAVPDGWQVLDYADFRFAVPPDWSCSSTLHGGDGLDAPSATCRPATSFPSVWLIIQGGQGAPPDGPRVPVGTLTAVVDPQASCPECLSRPVNEDIYHFDDGYTVTVLGPDRLAVLGTFTDAGRVRALESGPVEDTTSWQEVTFGDVSLEIPSSWPVVDLPGSHTETTDSGGVVVESGGLLDPGACGRGWFTTAQPPQAFTGISGVAPRCPSRDRTDLEPSLGVWIRDTTGFSPSPDATTVAQAEIDGARITIAYPDPSVPAIDLTVTTNGTTTTITIGVGPDSAIARTILQTISRA